MYIYVEPTVKQTKFSIGQTKRSELYTSEYEKNPLYEQNWANQPKLTYFDFF